MDKNTITGLVLIAILLVGFSFLSRPSKEQLAAQQRYYDSIAQVQQREADLKAKAEAALANDKEEQTADSTVLFFNALQGTDSQVTIQNNLAELTVATKGGRISSATLKEYMGQDKKTPVTLFSGNDASMNFLFYNKKETIQTENYYFSVVNRTDSTVTMRLAADSASYIDFKYAMHNDTYLVDFTIDAVGMANKLANTDYVDIEWSQRARQIEKGYTYENRLAELTYKITGDGTDYLSAGKNDEKEVAERLDWIAFKNQFFSSVFLADADFEKTKLNSKLETQGSGYIKDYSAEMSTAFDPTGKTPTQLFFYFGPNHYKTLTALDKGREDKWELNRLVYLGWPLIRWINKCLRLAVQLGIEHGYRSAADDIDCKGSGISRNLENVHLLCQNACTETENRRNRQEVSQAGRCHEEAAGSDGALQPIRCESDGRLSADADSAPHSNGIVYVRAECHRAAPAKFLVGR